jgi:hypothetical protein
LTPGLAVYHYYGGIGCTHSIGLILAVYSIVLLKRDTMRKIYRMVVVFASMSSVYTRNFITTQFDIGIAKLLQGSSIN